LEQRARVQVVRCDEAPTRAEALALLADADLLGATNRCLPHLDAALLDQLPRLRGIVLYATGYGHLDVDLLRSRGVGLSVLPGYATVAVAEHALAMLLSHGTRLHLANDRSRGLAPPDVSLRGVELAGRTLGIIGVGRIGGRLAQIAAGIGMEVLGTDVSAVATAEAVAHGVRMTSLSALLAGSDAVAVCASSVHGGAAILAGRELAQLRPGSFLVNVARADLVDTAAAVTAVRARHLRGYAVDDVVLDPAVDGDLLAEGRVLQTGHTAWWRDEVLARGSTMWADRMAAAAVDSPVDAVTWPEAIGPRRTVRHEWVGQASA